MGGKTFVCARREDYIESEDCLGDETVPLLGWKVGVTRGNSRSKVIIECANCKFDRVAAMCILGETLEVDIVFAEGFLHGT